MSYIPKNATIPPKVGEYGYYDSRIEKKRNLSHWIVRTQDKNGLGCFYSLKENLGIQSFINCHGVITEVILEVKKTYQ